MKTINEMQAVLAVYRYLKSTTELCITLGKIQDTSFLAYADPSHGDWHDSKSTEGAVWFFGGAPILWCSRKQSIMTPSSTAAEWCALDRPARDAQWFSKIATALNLPGAGESGYGATDSTGLVQMRRGRALRSHFVTLLLGWTH